MTDNLTPVHSIQEALQIYLPAIKHDDPKLAFYTMYEREATQRDTEYSSRTNEDLSITLLFVRFSFLKFSFCIVNRPLRLVCYRQSALHLSSTSSPSLNQTPATGPKPTSEQSSLHSILPSPHTKTLLLPRHGMVPPRRLSRP